MPGWIHRHRAVRRSADEIVVSGGRREADDGSMHAVDGTFVLNVRTRIWE